MSELSSLSYAPLESQRFGLKVFRGTIRDVNMCDILEILLENSIDLAILRLPSHQLRHLTLLNELGMPTIMADTLVYYSMDLDCYKPKLLRNSKLSFVMTTPEHTAVIDDLSQQIFKFYTNHYFSNPILSKESVLAGYQEWARSYITDLGKGRISWLVKNEDSFIAFATCSYSVIDKECEIILNGVIPEASGKGIYSDLIRYIQRYFSSKKIKAMKVSTQIQNVAAQKVWVNEGFTLKESYNTIHINSFLSKSLYPVKKLSGDIDILKNFVDPNYIIDVLCSFIPESKVNLQVKNYIGTKIKPLICNTIYSAMFSFPFVDNNIGYYKVLLKILDASDSVCSLTYYDCWRG